MSTTHTTQCVRVRVSGLAATWDTALATDYGAAVGREFSIKGANVVLGVSLSLRVAVLALDDGTGWSVGIRHMLADGCVGTFHHLEAMQS